MNDTLRLLLSHTSVRRFQKEKLTDSQKDQLLLAAQSGSSSNFLQAYSILEISDPILRAELAEITKSADYVNNSGVFYVFVADLFRHSELLKAKELPLTGIATVESLLVAIIDTTIAAQTMSIAAESMGLGICYIGGIRNNLDKAAELLQLPKYTVPIFGLTIGVPTEKNEVKPRIPRQALTAENYYHQSDFTALTTYDEIIKDYYQQRATNQQNSTWTEKSTAFFGQIRRPEVAAFLKKQGFEL